jgi:DNA-binding MarR family transcriptional regulator
MLMPAKAGAGKPTDAQPTAATPLDTLGKFRQIFESVRKHFAWVEEHCGISGAQLWALQEIVVHPGLKVTELATRLAVHQSTASNLVDKLIQKELITRMRSTEDLRVVKLFATQQGSEIIGRAPAPAIGVLPDALNSLAPEVLQSLDANLDTLLTVMKVRDISAKTQPLSDVFQPGEK